MVLQQRLEGDAKPLLNRAEERDMPPEGPVCAGAQSMTGVGGRTEREKRGFQIMNLSQKYPLYSVSNREAGMSFSRGASVFLEGTHGDGAAVAKVRQHPLSCPGSPRSVSLGDRVGRGAGGISEPGSLGDPTSRLASRAVSTATTDALRKI